MVLRICPVSLSVDIKLIILELFYIKLFTFALNTVENILHSSPPVKPLDPALTSTQIINNNKYRENYNYMTICDNDNVTRTRICNV